MGVEAGCAIRSSTTIPIAMGVEAIWIGCNSRWGTSPRATWWGGGAGEKEPGEEMNAVDVDGLQRQPFPLPSSLSPLPPTLTPSHLLEARDSAPHQ
jgi:hypothetical protein